MDGLLYILDQTGRALAQAQQRIEALTAENAALRAAATASVTPTQTEPPASA